MATQDHRKLLFHSVLMAAVTGALLASPARLRGHEIPADVVVRMFVRPEGARLRILVRVPLEAMRDMEFPVRGPGYLDLARSAPSLRDAVALWVGDEIEVFEDSDRLAVPTLVAARASLPSDRSFATYDDALAHLLGPPLPEATSLFWRQAMLDALFEVPIRSANSRFSLRTGVARLGLRVTTVLRFRPAEGPERAFQLVGDPGLLRLDPRWRQAALSFVRLGFLHILDGIDHLLFLLCLVLPVTRWRTLVGVVTAFTVAHSITLLGSAFGLAPTGLWFPPLVETLVAASIVGMALENILGGRLDRRWALAFGFGLAHGFGFSFALRDGLQFAGAHLWTALLSFNAGVELGQLLVVGLLVPVLAFAFRHVVGRRVGTLVISILVAHTAWHWMADRFSVLRAYEIPWRSLLAGTVGLRLGAWALILAGLAALAWGLVGRQPRRGVGRAEPLAAEE